jgi:hypothetical protein
MVTDDIGLGTLAGLSTFLHSDNSATVSWLRKWASKASSNVPDRILRLLAMRQRWDRRGPFDIRHWEGKTNFMGDFPSHPYEEGFSTHDDAAFLDEFSRRHPLPPQPGRGGLSSRVPQLSHWPSLS